MFPYSIFGDTMVDDSDYNVISFTKWYDPYVLAVPHSELRECLSECERINNQQLIRNLYFSNIISTALTTGSLKDVHVAYLTLDNYKHLIPENYHEEYEQRILVSKLNEVVSRPFALYSPTSLAHAGGLKMREVSSKKARDLDLVVAERDNTLIFYLDDDLIHEFKGRSSGSALLEDMHVRYSSFKNRETFSYS